MTMFNELSVDAVEKLIFQRISGKEMARIDRAIFVSDFFDGLKQNRLFVGNQAL